MHFEKHLHCQFLRSFTFLFFIATFIPLILRLTSPISVRQIIKKVGRPRVKLCRLVAYLTMHRNQYLFVVYNKKAFRNLVTLIFGIFSCRRRGESGAFNNCLTHSLTKNYTGNFLQVDDLQVDFLYENGSNYHCDTPTKH